MRTAQHFRTERPLTVDDMRDFDRFYHYMVNDPDKLPIPEGINVAHSHHETPKQRSMHCSHGVLYVSPGHLP